MTYHIGNSDPGHMYLKQQLEKNMKITFTNPSKNSAEKKEKKKQERQPQSFWGYTPRMPIAKLFALHRNAINSITVLGF